MFNGIIREFKFFFGQFSIFIESTFLSDIKKGVIIILLLSTENKTYKLIKDFADLENSGTSKN